MDLEKIEQDLINLSKKVNEESFIYDFLTVYGQPKATITRLKNC